MTRYEDNHKNKIEILQHVFREANQCADALVKLGAKFSAIYVSFIIPPAISQKKKKIIPPAMVVNLLALDRPATSCNRLISVVA